MSEKDNCSQNLPQAAAEYIESVIKKMRYRKMVRNEVRAELTGHFEDALKDCTSEQEKNQKVREMITEFGDFKLLAILIRRGKKRCRPLWRTLVARTFQGIGLFILCFIIYTIWFFSGKPNININYVERMNQLSHPQADENLNAEPFYTQAAELIKASLEDEQIKEIQIKDYEELTAEEKNVMANWLDNKKEILDLVQAGAARDYYWTEYRTDEGSTANEVFDIMMPNLGNFKSLARALRLRTMLNAEKGEFDKALKDINTCYRLGRHIKGTKTLIEQLVGIAIEAMALGTLRNVAAGHRMDPATLAQFRNDLEENMASEDFTMDLSLEKIFTLDEIQRCFTDDRIGSGHLYLKRFLEISIETSGRTEDDMLWEFAVLFGPALFTHPNKKQTLETTEIFYDYFEDLALKTPATIHSEQIDAYEDTSQIIGKNAFLSYLSPAISKIATLTYRIKAEAHATLSLLAILQYQRKNGTYPEILEALVESGLLKTVPIDPFSDKPLVYKRTDEGFTLYSIGLNLTDDGGEFGRNKRNGEIRVWGDEGDAVFWPVK